MHDIVETLPLSLQLTDSFHASHEDLECPLTQAHASKSARNLVLGACLASAVHMMDE